MAKRVIIGGIAGGIILFMWGFLSWVVLDLHSETILEHEGTMALIENGKDVLPHEGVYYFPPRPSNREDTAAMEVWMEAHRQGPVGMIFWQPVGDEPMSVTNLAQGLLLEIGMVMLAGVLLALALPSLPTYGNRLLFVTGLGLFVVLAARMSDWVFMGFPTRYTASIALGGVVSWVLVGLVLAGIVKPRQ